tara:strand:- start:2315 stop:4018 length:1704 start_codon:yes stop_codon:yes gene_type:complete
MALDRYESKVRLQPTDRITDAGTRQAMSSSQSLSKRLDAISSYALGQLQDKAKEEGQMYAVKNAPTIQQVTRAIEQDQDVNDLFAKEGTVFGDAARKVQAELFRQESVALLLNKGETIKTGIKENGINLRDVDSLATQLQAEIDGTYEIIASISPDSALKYSAQANQIGYDVYSVANAKAAQIEYKAKVAFVDDTEASYLNNFRDSLNTSNDFTKTAILTQHLRNDLVAYFGAITDDPARLSKLWKEENKVITDYIASTVADKDLLLSFASGDFKDFDAILIDRGLQDSKPAIISAALAKEKELNQALEARDKQLTLVNNDRSQDLEIEYLSGSSKLTPGQYIQAQQKNGRYFTAAEKRNIFSEPTDVKPNQGQINNFNVATQQLVLGQIGKNDIDKMFAEGRLTSKQTSTLIQDYIKETDKYTDGHNELRNRLNVSVNEIPGSEESSEKLAMLSELYITFDAEMRRRQASGERLDQIGVAREFSAESRRIVLGRSIEKKMGIINQGALKGMKNINEDMRTLLQMPPNKRIALYTEAGYQASDYSYLERQLLNLNKMEADLEALNVK